MVIGGYGRLGSHCVTELLETTAESIVIAGRSGQRAARVAMARGTRTRGEYLNVGDLRTLHPVLPSVSVVVLCGGSHCLSLLNLALQVRVPVVTSFDPPLDPRARKVLAERAWTEQIPVVLCAGAVPGLIGVVAESLVRRLPEISSLTLASTGPFGKTDRASDDLFDVRPESRPPCEYRGGQWLRPSRWRPRVRLSLEGALGTRSLQVARAPDLEGFPEANCVDQIRYLEPARSLVDRALDWTLGPPPLAPFQLEGVAHSLDGRRASASLSAPDPLVAAAVSIAVIVRAILADQVSPGLSLAREAINPAAHLAALEKGGVRVIAR